MVSRGTSRPPRTWRSNHDVASAASCSARGSAELCLTSARACCTPSMDREATHGSGTGLEAWKLCKSQTRVWIKAARRGPSGGTRSLGEDYNLQHYMAQPREREAWKPEANKACLRCTGPRLLHAHKTKRTPTSFLGMLRAAGKGRQCVTSTTLGPGGLCFAEAFQRDLHGAIAGSTWARAVKDRSNDTLSSA